EPIWNGLRPLRGSQNADHDDRRVVFAAGGIGGNHEFLGRSVGVRVDSQNVPYVIVAEHTVQAVAAQEDHVAADRLSPDDIELDLIVGADRTINYITIGVDAGLAPGEVSGVDHLLDQGMVFSDLFELVIVEQVAPAIANMGDGQDFADQHGDGE